MSPGRQGPAVSFITSQRSTTNGCPEQDEQSQPLSVSAVTRNGSHSDVRPGSVIDRGIRWFHSRSAGWSWARFHPCFSPHHWLERNLGKQEVRAA